MIMNVTTLEFVGFFDGTEWVYGDSVSNSVAFALKSSNLEMMNSV